MKCWGWVSHLTIEDLSNHVSRRNSPSRLNVETLPQHLLSRSNLTQGPLTSHAQK